MLAADHLALGECGRAASDACRVGLCYFSSEPDGDAISMSWPTVAEPSSPFSSPATSSAWFPFSESGLRRGLALIPVSAGVIQSALVNLTACPPTTLFIVWLRRADRLLISFLSLGRAGADW
jgi:hypothetical protein